MKKQIPKKGGETMKKLVLVMALVVVLGISGIASAFTCDVTIDDTITFRTESFLTYFQQSVTLPFLTYQIRCPGFVEIQKKPYILGNSTVPASVPMVEKGDAGRLAVTGKPNYFPPADTYYCEGNVRGQPFRPFMTSPANLNSVFNLNVNMELNCVSIYMIDIITIKKWEIPLI